MSTLAFYGQEYRVHERALALSGAVAGKAWGVLAESVEPAWVVWFASEVGKGVGEGWRRGVQREERWYGRGQMMTERAAASEEERETAALNFHR